MRTTPIVPGSFYHIYNRGVNKGDIFLHPSHWDYFTYRLCQYFAPSGSNLIAYSLLPNHYHLLVACGTADFGKRVMQPLMVSYTKSINQHLGRVGPLFQGPFQAIVVDKDAYLLHLTRYIHLNPVRAGLVNHPGDWAYSSYRDYVGSTARSWMDRRIILSQFRTPAEYGEYVCSGLQRVEDLPENLLLEDG